MVSSATPELVQGVATSLEPCSLVVVISGLEMSLSWLLVEPGVHRSLAWLDLLLQSGLESLLGQHGVKFSYHRSTLVEGI